MIKMQEQKAVLVLDDRNSTASEGDAFYSLTFTTISRLILKNTTQLAGTHNKEKGLFPQIHFVTKEKSSINEWSSLGFDGRQRKHILQNRQLLGATGCP